jgi:peptide/nickel transport system ATP-binding protein
MTTPDTPIPETGIPETGIPETGRPILEVRDLRTYFPVRNGVVKAVDGVSFTLHRGKTLCIVGESGSGKSVTARSILQIVDRPGRIEGGSMMFHRDDGSSVDLATLGPRSGAIRAVRGAEIAMIFQEPMSSLSPVHTIGNQIVEVLRLHMKMPKAQARARAIDLLKAVEIPNPERAIDRYTFEFSGGMRQRAMIAMAMLFTPELRRKNQLRNHQKIFRMYVKHSRRIDRRVRDANDGAGVRQHRARGVEGRA